MAVTVKYILRSFAQQLPAGDVNVEVIQRVEGDGIQPIEVSARFTALPTEEALVIRAIAKGAKTWDNDDLAAECAAILGQPVELAKVDPPPKPA